MPEAVQGIQAWDRFAYVNNNPVRYIDPSGHHYCDSNYADPEVCSGYDANRKQEQTVLNNLALQVWIESSEGVHSEVAISWISWVSINRYNSDRTKSYMASYVDFVKRFGGDAAGIIAGLVESGVKGASFGYVKSILMEAYNNYLMGETDPTNGAIFFVHASATNTGVTYDTVWYAKAGIQERSERMASSYTLSDAQRDMQMYPFTYNISDPYYVQNLDGQRLGISNDTGWRFLWVGNNICIAATSCGY